MVKQFEVLNWASSFLNEYNREEKVAEQLLQHHLNVSRSQFFMTMRETIDSDVVKRFKSDIKKHALTGKPIQHLMGYEYFYERKFMVNEHVLIPRQETEELVQLVIRKIKNNDDTPLTIVDVGTGSGVIAVTLALELSNVTVYAIDISEAALTIARKNADKLNANVHFLQGDFLQPLIERQISPHIIVSNPPYIKKSDENTLSDTVRNYDPHIALFANDKGLAAYKQIMEDSLLINSNLEKIFFEIGFDQAYDLEAIVTSTYPASNVNTIQDLNGKDRIIEVLIDK